PTHVRAAVAVAALGPARRTPGAGARSPVPAAGGSGGEGTRAGRGTLLRRPAPVGDRPRTGRRPVPADPGRAGGRDEPAGGGQPVGPDRLARRRRADHPADRAQRGHGDAHLLPDPGAGLRGADRHRQPGGDRRQPCGDRGLPGQRTGRGALPMNDAMLTVDRLRVSYGRVEAVREVSFRAEEGSLVTLVGANGAGKSSIVNAISGIVRPRGGRIRFRGKDITRTPAHRLVGQGLVQVPEGRQILTSLTIEENLQMGGWHAGSAGIDDVYHRFPVLAERRHLPAGSLSGGEQQMLAIGRALVAEPSLVLLDEPSMGLAPLVVDEVFAVIGEIRARGTT